MTDEQIVNTITASLQSQLDAFTPERQRHFAERLYRLTGNQQYIPVLKHYVELIHSQFIYYLGLVDDKNKMKTAGRKIIAKMRTRQWIKYYKKVPELRLIQKLIFYLNKFREYQVNQVLDSEEHSQAIAFLKSLPLKKYFLDPEIIKTIPGQTTNYIFWLKRLGVINLMPYFLPELGSRLVQMEFKNQAYGLTHVIIASSDYYQNFVDPKNYAWILNWLSQNLDKVLTTKNKDLIAEVGVSFKLIQSCPEHIEKIKDYLRPLFNLKKGCFGSKKNLEDLEHTNVLAIFLFKDFKKLYPGPKIKISL